MSNCQSQYYKKVRQLPIKHVTQKTDLKLLFSADPYNMKSETSHNSFTIAALRVYICDPANYKTVHNTTEV